MTDLERLAEAFHGVTIAVGLRAQGHLPTVERMLSKGASWDEIGRAIGWHGETARQWYEQEIGAIRAGRVSVTEKGEG